GRPHTLVRVNRTRSRSARQRREPGPQAPPAATRPHLATPAPRPPVRTTTLTTEPRPTPADGQNSSVRVGRSVDVPGAASPRPATGGAARSSPCPTVPTPCTPRPSGPHTFPALLHRSAFRARALALRRAPGGSRRRRVRAALRRRGAAEVRWRTRWGSVVRPGRPTDSRS